MPGRKLGLLLLIAGASAAPLFAQEAGEPTPAPSPDPQHAAVCHANQVLIGEALDRWEKDHPEEFRSVDLASLRDLVDRRYLPSNDILAEPGMGAAFTLHAVDTSDGKRRTGACRVTCVNHGSSPQAVGCGSD